MHPEPNDFSERLAIRARQTTLANLRAIAAYIGVTVAENLEDGGFIVLRYGEDVIAGNLQAVGFYLCAKARIKLNTRYFLPEAA